MKTLRLTVELTYDDELWHGPDKEPTRWFNEDILLCNKDLTLDDRGDAGDTIGSINVIYIEETK